VTRQCSLCGTANPDKYRYCVTCGARLDSRGASSPLTQPVAPPGPLPSFPGPGAMPGRPGGVPRYVQNGRYILESVVGQGGMSAVYRARDTHFSDRVVAVKEMVDQFADAADRAEAEANFRQESDLLTTLRHPAIPQVIDRFSENSRHYLVMEFIDGKSLEDMIDARSFAPLPEDRVRAWMLEVCSVLAYLHSRTPPIIFRDLKPSNVMVESDGQVRLIDFGIARLFKPQKTSDTTALGTTGYASPEHYTGQTDPRSDIYSLGAMLHYLLSGRDPSKFPPFQFPPLNTLNPALSPAIVGVVTRCLAPDRLERFASMADVDAALRANLAGAPPGPAPPPRPPAAPPTGAVPAQGVPSGNLLVLAGVRSDADRAEVIRRVSGISGSSEKTTGALLKNLPAVIPVVQPAALPTEMQHLVRLGVDARTAQPRTDIVDISQDLRHELQANHQLVIWDATVGASRTCHCHRCNHVWRTKKQMGEKVPRYCPQCGSQEWSKRRLFKCGWCANEFESPDLVQAPEAVWPRCPSCGLSDWLHGAPSKRSPALPAAAAGSGGGMPVAVRVGASFISTDLMISAITHTAVLGPHSILILLGSWALFGRSPRRRRHRP